MTTEKISTHRDEYNASSIRVLSEDEARSRFGWANIERLAQQYGKSARWIERGFEACRRAGVDPDYFVSRYLRGDDIPRLPLVEDAFRQMRDDHP